MKGDGFFIYERRNYHNKDGNMNNVSERHEFDFY